MASVDNECKYNFPFCPECGCIGMKYNSAVRKCNNSDCSVVNYWKMPDEHRSKD